MRKKAIIFVAVFVLVVLYFFRWQGDWSIINGSEIVQVISLDFNHFGLTPQLRWNAKPARLMIVPSTGQVPPGETALAMVVDLETRQTRWQSVDEIVDFDEWKLTSGFGMFGAGESGGAFALNTGQQVELLFSGFTIPRPIYDFLGWPDSRTGWVVNRGYFGRLHLVVRDLESGPVVAEFVQTLFNFPFLHDASSLADWLPADKPFLIVQPDGGDLLFAVGPIN